MIELLRTNDPVELSWVQAVLADEDIACVVFDHYTALAEGSISAVPRRIMVADQDASRARWVLQTRHAAIEQDRSADFLLGGKVVLHQSAEGYRAAIDPVFLAASVAVRDRREQKILDVGCGAGAVMLCLGARLDRADITGIDRQSDAVALACDNINANGWGARMQAVKLDIRDKDVTPLTPQSFDQVVSNPPYFDSGTPAATDARAIAHGDGSVTLRQWLVFCLKMLRHKGRLHVVHRAGALAEILAILQGRAGEIDVLPLFARERDGAAGRVIVSARKGTRSGTRIRPGFVIHDGPGRDYTEAAEAILQDGAAFGAPYRGA